MWRKNDLLLLNVSYRLIMACVYVIFNENWYGSKCDKCGKERRAFLHKTDAEKYVKNCGECCDFIIAPFAIESVNIGDKVYILVTEAWYGGYDTDKDVFKAFKTKKDANEYLDTLIKSDDAFVSHLDVFVNKLTVE